MFTFEYAGTRATIWAPGAGGGGVVLRSTETSLMSVTALLTFAVATSSRPSSSRSATASDVG